MKSFEEIYNEMKEAFAERTGFAPNESCDSSVRLYVLASQVHALLTQAEWVLAQSFPQTAQGEYLDYHAFSRGIERGAAKRAQGVIRFAAQESAAVESSIAAGTVCLTSSGVRFETKEDAVLAVGESWVDVPAQAVEAGAEGNVVAGAITLMSAPSVGIVQCSNTAPFVGGSDAEDDASLRARILESYQRLPNGANAAYYEREAMSFSAVAAAKAVGRARGIGTVDVYVSVDGGVPSEELLAEIQAALSAKREIGVDVQVLAPTVKTVDVSVGLSAAENETFETVQARVESAIRAFFTGALLGENVLTARLGALIYGVEGVENCHILAPASDVSAAETELPVLGTLTLTQLSK